MDFKGKRCQSQHNWYRLTSICHCLFYLADIRRKKKPPFFLPCLNQDFKLPCQNPLLCPPCPHYRHKAVSPSLVSPQRVAAEPRERLGKATYRHEIRHFLSYGNRAAEKKAQWCLSSRIVLFCSWFSALSTCSMFYVVGSEQPWTLGVCGWCISQW